MKPAPRPRKKISNTTCNFQIHDKLYIVALVLLANVGALAIICEFISEIPSTRTSGHFADESTNLADLVLYVAVYFRKGRFTAACLQRFRLAFVCRRRYQVELLVGQSGQVEFD